MGHYKYCKICGGRHRKQSAYNRCKRRNQKEYWK